MLALAPYVTPMPWGMNLQHAHYGDDQTYGLAADWLQVCAEVADWGGGTGYARKYLPVDVPYTVIDGTVQGTDQVLADLAEYHVPSAGILLRHVLDMTMDWRAVLTNARAAFTHRMVVITFTPDVAQTHYIKLKSGWPITHFNPADLHALMGDDLVADIRVLTSHPERVYLLEKRP